MPASYTTEDLYEQAKRSLRHLTLDAGIAKEGEPAFILACHECGLPFRTDIEIGMIGDHARVHGLDPDEGWLTVDLIWIGEGPPPKGRNAG